MIELVVAAAQAARLNGDAATADAAAYAKAEELGITLPGEDFCLHGLYGNTPCTVCKAIFS